MSKKYFSLDGLAGGIHKASFRLDPGTFFTLLGPSGCGKTTTLRCIAGLEHPDEGEITIGEKTVFNAGKGIAVPMDRRGIGMVFQSYAIWPHLTVFENVAFPLRVSKRRFSNADLDARVRSALGTVGLESYSSRPATRLSGGQQQRVALARAIVSEPKLLLLDEPLSNLDASLREGMRQELKRLQRQLGLTTVYVTHDQTEALAISDRIAVLDKGRIVQLGTPQQIYFEPKNAFVAGFVGTATLLAGRVDSGVQAAETSRVQLKGNLSLACRFPTAVNAGTAVVVALRPESIMIGGSQQAANRLDGTLVAVDFFGATKRCEVMVGDLKLLVDVRSDFPTEIGTSVSVSVAPEDCIAVPME